MKNPNCFKPWCGVDGKYCVDCASYSKPLLPDQSATSSPEPPQPGTSATGHLSAGVIHLDDAPIHFGEYAAPLVVLARCASNNVQELLLAMPSKSDADPETYEALKLAGEIIDLVRKRIDYLPPVTTLLEKMNSEQ